MNDTEPLLRLQGIGKNFGPVTALSDIDLDIPPGQVTALVGDNGAGKSTLIKCLSGALVPDRGKIFVNGREVRFRSPQDARNDGIETVHQVLAIAPALDIASNLFLGREIRRKGPLGSLLRMLDTREMRRQSTEQIKNLGIATLQNIGQAAETLSGGQRQAVAVARASAFGSHVVILDEPTAALGVRETGQVLKLIRDLRATGKAVILISHDMPNVFELADRIQIQRLGACAGVITPKTHTMEDAVALMTGAKRMTASHPAD